MSILTLQRRFRELGRIRMGHQTPSRDGKLRPAKLETFRLTSPSRDLIEAAAVIYGGTVQPWMLNDRHQWEVFTEAKSMDIIVPPGAVLSQFMEMWSGGGCERRCDGVTELLSDAPCVCPVDPEVRRELAAKGKACKETTRLNVMLRALPDIGVWRLESHGWHAAVELAGTAQILEIATKQGQMIPATLRLDPREKREPGKPINKYVVPVIEIKATFGQVAEALGVLEAPTAIDYPTPMAALPAGSAVRQPGSSRAALPEAPKGRTRPVNYPAPPDLPSDPSFTIDPPVVAGSTAPLPGDTDQATKRSQQLHISARNSNCLDMLGELVEWATDGRTTSSKEVTDEEASKLHQAFSEIKRGKRVVSYDGGGKLVLS